MKEVPILNIYYLLCYAWDKLDEGNKVNVGASDYRQLIDLFARVLVNGCGRLFKRGLDRGYIEISEPYNGVKGKINFGATLNANLIGRGKAICEFDDFQSNVLQNQIIKATLLRISKVPELDSALHTQVRKTYDVFSYVDDIALRRDLFSRVKIHRNNSFYDFLLRICWLVVESTVIDESNGTYSFTEFSRERMGQLFEAFVRNFYLKEQTKYDVRRPKIQWVASAIGESDIGLLPDMNTDMVLRSDDRKIVIDTKFYQNTTAEYYGTQKIHSPNLYQIYSYLRNLESDESDSLNKIAEGMLLYPTVKSEYDHQFWIGGHQVRIATVDLTKGWRDIELRLKAIIE